MVLRGRVYLIIETLGIRGTERVDSLLGLEDHVFCLLFPSWTSLLYMLFPLLRDRPRKRIDACLACRVHCNSQSYRGTSGTLGLVLLFISLSSDIRIPCSRFIRKDSLLSTSVINPLRRNSTPETIDYKSSQLLEMPNTRGSTSQ